MLTLVDARLRAEAQRFELRFACERCAHYDPEQERCANGYPATPQHQSELAVARELAFCKEFELA